MLTVAIVVLLTINSQGANANMRMFGQVTEAEAVEEVEDRCKAYQSNEGYAYCQKRQANIKRMQAAKEKRAAYRSGVKKRLKSKGARGATRKVEEAKPVVEKVAKEKPAEKTKETTENSVEE